MGKMIEYLKEAEVSYRHLKDGESADVCETVHVVVACHHPSGKSFNSRVAVLTGRRDDIYRLVNHWNRQPGSGWSYYT